ncbi:MAG: hypothetical protein ACRDBP_05315 [Luteolibacter sp.]
MIQIIISALILCASLYLIARHEAEISLPVVLMITVGVSVISVLLSLFIGPFAFLVALVILAFAIQRFCYVGWPKAFAVTGIYAVTNIVLGVGMHLIRKA